MPSWATAAARETTRHRLLSIDDLEDSSAGEASDGETAGAYPPAAAPPAAPTAPAPLAASPAAPPPAAPPAAASAGSAPEIAPASESRSAAAAADEISLESSDGVCSDVSWVDIGDYGAPAPAMAIEPTEPHPVAVVRKAPPLLGDATARACDECDDDALEAEWWRGAQQRAQHEAFAEEVEQVSSGAALALRSRGAARRARLIGLAQRSTSSSAASCLPSGPPSRTGSRLPDRAPLGLHWDHLIDIKLTSCFVMAIRHLRNCQMPMIE